MTEKTKFHLIKNIIIITINTMLAITIGSKLSLITSIPYIGIVSSTAVYIISGIIDVVIIFWFLLFWWSENKWRDIKRKFRRHK